MNHPGYNYYFLTDSDYKNYKNNYRNETFMCKDWQAKKSGKTSNRGICLI